MCNYSKMIYPIHWNQSEQDKYVEQLIIMLPRKLVRLHKAIGMQLVRGLPLPGDAKFPAATSAEGAIDMKTDSRRIHVEKHLRYVALHPVLWNKKVVCKEELELHRGLTNGSRFTADLANVVDPIWWLLTGFLNRMHWVEPHLDALSPSIEYSVTGSASCTLVVQAQKVTGSADGGVYIKNVSSRMHAPKYSRDIDSVSKADSLEARYKFIHMMNGAQGINAGQPMHLFILDSGSPVHCTGDGSLFSVDYTEAPPDRYICGANGGGMRVHGVGSIRNDKIQVQDVLYVPELNQPNINKTLISVTELTNLGYRVNFGGTSCSVIDNRKRTWTWKHEIVGEAHIERGHYLLDYLSIPLDRDPVPTSSELPRLLKSLWDAALSGWNTIIEPLRQRASTQRPEV